MFLRLALDWWTFTEGFVYLAVQVLFLCMMIVSFEGVEFIIVGIFPMELGWYLCDHFCVINIFTEMISGTCGL